MGTKQAKKALLEVIPQRFCGTFRRGSVWFRPKGSKMLFSNDKSQNTTNTGPGSLDNFSGNHKNHENRSELDPYSTFRAENQGFWSSKVLRSQWDHWGPQKLAYKIQNRPKNPKTQPTQLSTKFGHQPYVVGRQEWLANWHTWDSWQSISAWVNFRRISTWLQSGSSWAAS